MQKTIWKHTGLLLTWKRLWRIAVDSVLVTVKMKSVSTMVGGSHRHIHRRLWMWHCPQCQMCDLPWGNKCRMMYSCSSHRAASLHCLLHNIKEINVSSNHSKQHAMSAYIDTLNSTVNKVMLQRKCQRGSCNNYNITKFNSLTLTKFHKPRISLHIQLASSTAYNNSR